ncbi:hypothetical protein HaLaN_07734 [Haematococcus lacustris]|uniref:Uncharacterized protein n=1 Tax=Haematococcus lacustris TaxID=44745 RepID=A0A699YS59_HAELA|nr:hypothetical protein HaLaN_07734 [Haematococcus lacustris]
MQATWRVELDAAALTPGLAVVEVQSGRTLSNFKACLVVDDPGVLAEVQVGGSLVPVSCSGQQRRLAVKLDKQHQGCLRMRG